MRCRIVRNCFPGLSSLALPPATVKGSNGDGRWCYLLPLPSCRQGQVDDVPPSSPSRGGGGSLSRERQGPRPPPRTSMGGATRSRGLTARRPCCCCYCLPLLGSYYGLCSLIKVMVHPSFYSFSSWFFVWFIFGYVSYVDVLIHLFTTKWDLNSYW